MRKYLLMLSLTLPLLAQQTETDKEITKEEQRENRTATGVKEGRQKKSWGKRAWMGLQDADWKKYNAAHDRAHNKKDGMKRGVDNRDRRMMMAKRREMQRKRFWRSTVRVVVIGGVAYYIGYKVGQDEMKKGHKGKKPITWLREDKKWI